MEKTPSSLEKPKVSLRRTHTRTTKQSFSMLVRINIVDILCGTSGLRLSSTVTPNLMTFSVNRRKMEELHHGAGEHLHNQIH